MGREVDMVIVWPLGGNMGVVCVREGLAGRCGLRGVAFKTMVSNRHLPAVKVLDRGVVSIVPADWPSNATMLVTK